MSEITLSEDQQRALEAAVAWLATWERAKKDSLEEPSSDPEDEELPPTPFPSQVFRLFGYAGTGKTTVIRTIIKQMTGVDNPMQQDAIMFAAFTGKAASVMRRNSLPAGTIHSLIYHLLPPNQSLCAELYNKIRETNNEAEKRRLQAQLDEEQKPKFDLRPADECALRDARLLVVDEVSMVDEEMGEDLLTYEIPILVLGDPGQLPPIKGTGFFVQATPDMLLTQIHRQAEGDPIIDFATRARNGVPIPRIQQGKSRHCFQAEVTREDVLAADQILTGKNVTRQDINRRYRSMTQRSSTYPEVGEKLICLRNGVVSDPESGEPISRIFNGQMFRVAQVGELRDNSVELDLVSEDHDPAKGAPRVLQVLALLAHFDSYHDKNALKNVKWWQRTDTHEFDFGYAITVHKAQGSQWDNVIVFDDKFLAWDKDERKKWLYTAITRAAKSITLAD